MRYAFITCFLLSSTFAHSQQAVSYQTVNVERISLTRAIFTGKVFNFHHHDDDLKANYFATDLSEFKRTSPPPIEYLLKIENKRQDYTELLKECRKSFSNDTEASAFFSKMGWDYLADGQREEARKRFDWAYLLDGQNTDAFWGLGVMTFQESRFIESTLFMEQGLKVSDHKNVTLMVDLATVYATLFTEFEQPHHLKRATELLDAALVIHPLFSQAYMQKAMNELIKGNHAAAWINFHKGHEIAPAETDVVILAALLAQQPDPKGIFFRQ